MVIWKSPRDAVVELWPASIVVFTTMSADSDRASSLVTLAGDGFC